MNTARPNRSAGRRFGAAALFGLLSFENKETLSVTREKLDNDLRARSQKMRDQAGGAIADAQPDKLRRMAEDDGPLVKIRILGSNRKSILPGPIPNDPIIRLLQVDRLDVRRPGK
jgi:hypothetical protein